MQFPAFIVYLVAATAEVNRTPFDLPEAETELVAGFHTEYSSMRFALLQMAEYVNMITVSAVGTNLFLGGWLSADPGRCPTRRSGSSVKMLAVLFFFIWLRGHAAPLPLRPAHALRLEGAGAGGHGLDPGDRGPRALAASVSLVLFHAILFYVFAGLAVGSALVVVGQRNPIYSAFALIVTLCSLSAIYGLLGSPFIAVLQIVVYAGAIMVLFLFVLMLLNVRAEGTRTGRAASSSWWRSPWARSSSVEVGSVLAAVRTPAGPGLRRLHPAGGPARSSPRASSTSSRPPRS